MRGCGAHADFLWFWLCFWRFLRSQKHRVLPLFLKLFWMGQNVVKMLWKVYLCAFSRVEMHVVLQKSQFLHIKLRQNGRSNAPGAHKICIFRYKNSVGFLKACIFTVKCCKMCIWDAESMHFYGRCAAGVQKVCIFTVGARLGRRKYAFLR